MSEAVLFVDDAPVILSAVRRALKGERYDVVTASSGKEALAIVEERRVDMIVADECMPGMQGWELLAIVAERHPLTMRVILTGNATVESTLRAINETRVFRYLVKPVDPAELRDVIEAGLDLRKRLAPPNEDHLAALSIRERQVMLMVTRGQRVSLIAEDLSLSPHTVRNHIKNIFRKLGAHSQAELVRRFGPPTAQRDA